MNFRGGTARFGYSAPRCSHGRLAAIISRQSRWPPTLCHWYAFVYICMYMYMHMYICGYIYMYMQNIVSFIEYRLFYMALLQKRPIILRKQSRWPPTLCHW